jgi:hypothetical protein
MRLAAFSMVLLMAGVPALACGPERLERATVARVSAEGDIHLTDGRAVWLAGLHQPQAHAVPLRAGDAIAVGPLGEMDRWSRLPAVVFALPDGGEPVWLQDHLARSGRALVRPMPALGGCWPLLAAAEAKASARPATPDEPGRFARVEGRVGRVGEGRTAMFVNVYGAAGQRATGLIQKRHMRRLAEAGVDVKALAGHIVRLRGVRSLRNSQVIALTRAEQIEIVR